jgi:hypothetical protein
MKFNLAQQENEDSNDDNDKQIFCSDLDKIEIALPKDDDGDYELVFNAGPTKTQAKAAAEEVRKDALANVSNQCNMQVILFWLDTKGEINVDDRYTYHHHAGHNELSGSKKFMQKKRKSMMELKKYTGSASKKTKKDRDKFKGWSEEGKSLMVKVTKVIKDDVEL